MTDSLEHAAHQEFRLRWKPDASHSVKMIDNYNRKNVLKICVQKQKTFLQFLLRNLDYVVLC